MDEELKSEVKDQITRLINAEENASKLTGDNMDLVSRTKLLISELPKNSELSNYINNELDRHYEKTKEIGNTASMQIVDGYRQAVSEHESAPLALVRTKPEETKLSRKAAFVNVAILLYGILNIGFILAVALIKNIR